VAEERFAALPDSLPPATGQQVAIVAHSLVVRLDLIPPPLLETLGRLLLRCRAEQLAFQDLGILVAVFAKVADVSGAGTSLSSPLYLFSLQVLTRLSRLATRLLRSPEALPGNLDMMHHHADGTVHAHPRGATLHTHDPKDGSPTAFEGRAPFGGEFVRFRRPGGVVVSTGGRGVDRGGAPPASAICPLLWRHAEVQVWQTLAALGSGLARAGVRDLALFRQLGVVVGVLPPPFLAPLPIVALLHALAALDIPDKALLPPLLRAASLLPPPVVSPQAAANLAWSLAVLVHAPQVRPSHLFAVLGPPPPNRPRFSPLHQRQ
ncbi:hypothetical protein T484DRAFT_1822371, partial [Baffinella frigidus]